MKHRILRLLALTMSILLLCGCDPFYGKRPTDYKNSKWVCQDPNIMFTVNEKKELYWELNGAATRYDLALGMGTNFRIHDDETGRDLMKGQSTYSAEKMTVDITMDLLFDGKYEGKRIVFHRVE